MYKDICSVVVTIFSVILLTVISILFINESIIFDNYKKQSLTAFMDLKNELANGNIYKFTSIMQNLHKNMPILKTLRIKNDQNLPIYFYSESKENLKTMDNDFEKQYSSIYRVIYANEVAIDNSMYNLEAVFTVLSENRLFYLLTKIALIFFIYLFFLSFILIYIYSNKASINTKRLINNEKRAPVVFSDSKYLSSDQMVTDELKKSASFDQDLVLTLVGSPEKYISNNATEFKEILNKHFPFHDLIFRFNDNIFGIMLPNTDLEQGIHQIELFDQKFVSSSTKSLKFPIMFGLSSRNGRLISGNIILKEAKAALIKAMSDNDFPIVGFRPNPARYREYLSKLRSKS